MMRCRRAEIRLVAAPSGPPAAARLSQDAPSKRCSSPGGTGVPMSDASVSITQPLDAKPAQRPSAARTRLLLEGPIVPTLLRLAAPNVVVNVVLIAVTA